MNDLTKESKFDISIRTKVILFTVISITFVLGAYTAYSYYKSKSDLEKSLNALTESTAKKLKSNLKVPLWNLDFELISEAIEAEMLTEAIVAIFVYDEDNETTLSGKGRSLDGNIANIKNHKNFSITGYGEIYEKSTPIFYDSKNIGSVKVYVTDKYEIEKIKFSMLSLIFALILLDLIIVLVLWITLRTLLKKPLLDLAGSVEKISQGDFSVDIHTKKNDEIGVVIQAVARMRLALLASFRKVKRYEEIRKVKN
ncbi:MAG: HAMP domain-containing protein [Cellvibrionaceae bacterium]